MADYLQLAATNAALQLAYLLGPFVLIALVMGAAGAVMTRVLLGVLPHRLALWGFLAPGVIVHELCHVVACWIFGHRVTEAVLFDPKMRTGAPGYVEHEWNPANPWSNMGCFFIGVAPALLGMVLVHQIGTWALGPIDSSRLAAVIGADQQLDGAELLAAGGAVAYSTAAAAINGISAGQLAPWIYLYAMAVMGAVGQLSKADWRVTARGAGFVLSALLCLNLAFAWAFTGDAGSYAGLAALYAPIWGVGLAMVAAKLAVAGLVALTGGLGLLAVKTVGPRLQRTRP